MTSRNALFLCLVLMAAAVSVACPAGDGGAERLMQRIEAIDADFEGNLGVYLHHRGADLTVMHQADRHWYLASTIKIPLAIAVLQRVEAGELDLEQELKLERSDYVDGTGELLFAEPGHRFTLDELLAHTIRNSDSTATDMLIRLIGEEEFNRQIREDMGIEDFERFTTIVQVRFDAYAEVHPAVSELDNMDFVEIKSENGLDDRYRALLERLKIDSRQALAEDIPTAFERYYRRGLNSGSLVAMGELLERLIDGELLGSENTRRVLGYMTGVTTGDHRIKAGLSEGVEFAHKTGTQIRRACNTGIVDPYRPEQAVIVAVCAEGFDRLSEAERAMARIGGVIAEI